MKLSVSDSLYLFIKGSILGQRINFSNYLDQRISDLYLQNKDPEDGLLYINFAFQDTFG